MKPAPNDPASASPLGKVVNYRDTYAPELLFSIPRQPKRAELGLEEGSLPFVGEDVWNAYELSWLNLRGKPVVALGRFRVPADSPDLIESKSLKLYLNSFNQSRFEDLATVAERIARDLSEAARIAVTVSLWPLTDARPRSFRQPEGVLLDELDIGIDTYTLAPDLLHADPVRVVESELLYSHLLKSNCLVTGQPDWGSIMIRYSGPAIDRAGLLRYIVSLRRHNEFHEQCVERVFCDLLRRCVPNELAVWACYTRRGGLDINPFRSTGIMAVADEVVDPRQ